MRAFTVILPLVLGLTACQQQTNEQVEQATEKAVHQVERSAQQAAEDVKETSQAVAQEGEHVARVADIELTQALDDLDQALDKGDRAGFEKHADRALNRVQAWIEERRLAVKDSSKLAPVLDEADAEVKQLRADLHALEEKVDEQWHAAARKLRSSLNDLSQNMNAALEQ